MRLRPIAAISLAALLILPLAACSSSGSSSGYPERASQDFDSSSSGSAASSEIARVDGTTTSMNVDVNVQGQSVIRNGTIEISVDNTTAAAESVTALVVELGGFVESETLRGSDGGSSEAADLTVRIPADRFDEAYEQLATVGTVLAQSKSSTDVTAQHVDLQARIGALEDSIARLTELMRGATTTADLLEAESALSSRQQELDGLNAQLTALEGQVDLSSIWVRLATDSVIPGGPGNFWDGLSTGWNSMVQALAGGIVIAGILLPWLLLAVVLVGVVWFVTRSARRRRRGGRDAAGTVTDDDAINIDVVNEPVSSDPQSSK